MSVLDPNQLTPAILADILATLTTGSTVAPTKSYLSYTNTTVAALTSTPVLMTNFVQDISPVGFTQANGVFTVDDVDGGIYKFDIERTYRNSDTNPADIVTVTINVHINDISVFTKSLPLPAATAATEPAIESISTPFIDQLADGDTIKIYFSAIDGVAEVSDCSLIFSKLVAHKIFAV